MLITLGLAFALGAALLTIHAAVWLGFRARDAFAEWRWRRAQKDAEVRAFYRLLREEAERRAEEPPQTLRSP